MISSLAPCFTGIFLRFKDGLALPGEHSSSIAGQDLLDRSVAEHILSRFAETYPGGDTRALVSMWTQWHFGALIIPTTAAILLLDRDLPVDLARVSIAFHENGGTAAVILADDGEHRRENATDRFSRLFRGHVEPLIGHLAAQFKVSPRMLWTNAADIFEWTIQQAATMGHAHPEALSEARALLDRKIGASGSPNPMFGLVRYPKEDGRANRKRKICCLRYLLPGVECCGGICPLPPARH